MSALIKKLLIDDSLAALFALCKLQTLCMADVHRLVLVFVVALCRCSEIEENIV